MFYRYLLNPSGWKLMLGSLFLCLVCVSLIDERGVLRSPTVFCEVQCVLWALVKFLLWMWVPLHLEHRCSELRVLLGIFFLWWIWSVLRVFFDDFWLKVQIIWYQNGYSSLFPGTICLENCFPAFYSEVVFVFDTEVCFLYAATWVLFPYLVC